MGGEKQGKGTQENCSAVSLTVSGFMIMGLVPKLSLVSYLAWSIFGLTWDSSWWCVYLSAKMESREKDSGRLAEDTD